MSEIRELIKKLASAEQGDWELEAEIEAVISEWWNLGGWWREHKVTGEKQQYTHVDPPYYTRSVDAALLLLPDDATNEITAKADWQLSSINGGLTIFAKVGSAGRDEFASTPALALCIAALKARFPEA